MNAFATRQLGKNGPAVSAVGLGCMGMSEFYGHADEAESIRVIHRALDMGMSLLDTADVYGIGRNEELVGRAVRDRRDKAFIATKFGNIRDAAGKWLGINGKRDYVRQACEASLKRLKMDRIDLYYQHRVDPETPIEETVGAMAELVRQGKVKHLGLSEAAPQTIRRAAKVHPIAALQTEYSLWSREPESEILPACRDLSITFVAYSPLGRGFLTGRFKSVDDLPPDDWRHQGPRFQGENFQKNLKLLRQVEKIASEKNCSPSQLVLAWVLARGQNIIPIPGTKHVKYLEDNAAAVQIKLTTQDLDRLEQAFPFNAAAGNRYPQAAMQAVNR